MDKTGEREKIDNTYRIYKKEKMEQIDRLDKASRKKILSR